MSATLVDLGDAARMLRDALKDKSYRSTPLGLEVARYIRWKRTEWGAQPETIRDYESVLARSALFFSDLELSDFEIPVGQERLRECWDHYWGDKAGRTRSKVRSIWVDFFDWAVREDRGIRGNPARMLASPKRRGVKREPFGKNLVDRVIAGQDYVPDKLGVILVLRYAVRRGELGQIRFRDFDFERRTLVVTGKGGKVRVIPIIGEAFWRNLGQAEIELGGREQILNHFLICPRRKIGMKTFYQHHHGFVARSVHTWWYDRLEAAGIVGDERKGFGMHRGRHTVATDIVRRTGNLTAAQELLGHADITTTRNSYASFDTDDLRDVMVSLAGDDDDDF